MRRVFPPLPLQVDPPSQTARPPRICIASYEFVGPTKNGGIGTAYTSLAEALAAAGHEITCLFVGEPPVDDPKLEIWVRSYREKGIRLVLLDTSNRFINGRKHFARSYDAYQWFKRNRDFDVVHFPELLGCGYHTLEAKRQGLIFEQTAVCVGIHSMTQWLRTAMNEWMVGVVDLELDFMERQSVALANCVVSPSQYLLNWIVDQGWSLPAHACVQPYVQSMLARTTASAVRVTKPVDEFVFFGRLETRKGIVLFCDAMARLALEANPRIRQVTFLGRENLVEGQKACDYIRARSKGWPFPVQLLTQLDQPEAIAYLRGEGRMAVIPSLMENSPNTVYECLGVGIPFLASRAGGIPELICTEDANDICFDLSAEALAERLRGALSAGVATSRLAIDVAANEGAWVEWHRQTALSARRPSKSVHPVPPPRVSVCVPTFNRPMLLEQALSSIRKSNHTNLEVIVVDDGSFTLDAKDKLAAMEPDFAKRGWRILRQPNRFPGAARNAAARLATGEYLFFMDDDDIALPDQISTLLKVAIHTRADIVTSGTQLFEGTFPPQASKSHLRTSLPLGSAAAVGAYYNCFGEGNLLVKRATYERLGGFTEDFGIAGEEAEFYANAVLSGASLVVIPEFLYWRRDHAECLRLMLGSQPTYTRRRLRPYERCIPTSLRALLGLGSSLFHRELARATAPTEYEMLSIQWRSKLEAGTSLARMNHREAAVSALVNAVKSIEGSKNWLVVLEALLTVGEAMCPLDIRRAATLAGMAKQLASLSPCEQHREQANRLMNLVNTAPARGVPAS